MGIHYSWISVEKTNFMDLVVLLNLKQLDEKQVIETGEYNFVGYPCKEWYVFRSSLTFLHDKQMLNELSIKYKVAQGDVLEGDLSTIRLWEEGKEKWSISYDSDTMFENLVVTGEFPESLDALKKQFDPEDYYEIPLEVTYSTIGYSHYEPVEERHFYLSQSS